jgi:hypothetical protein
MYFVFYDRTQNRTSIMNKRVTTCFVLRNHQRLLRLLRGSQTLFQTVPFLKLAPENHMTQIAL